MTIRVLDCPELHPNTADGRAVSCSMTCIETCATTCATLAAQLRISQRRALLGPFGTRRALLSPFGHSSLMATMVGSQVADGRSAQEREDGRSAINLFFLNSFELERTVRRSGEPDSTALYLTGDDALDYEWGLHDDSRAYEAQLWRSALDQCTMCQRQVSRRNMWRWLTLGEVLVSGAAGIPLRWTAVDRREMSMFETGLSNTLGLSPFNRRLVHICSDCGRDLDAAMAAWNFVLSFMSCDDQTDADTMESKMSHPSKDCTCAAAAALDWVLFPTNMHICAVPTLISIPHTQAEINCFHLTPSVSN